MTRNPRTDWYIHEAYTGKHTLTPKGNCTWSWYIIFGIDLESFFLNLFQRILDSKLVNPLESILQCKDSLKTWDPCSAFQSLLENGERVLHRDEKNQASSAIKCLWVSFSNHLICSSAKIEVVRLCLAYVMISVLNGFHGSLMFPREE